MVAARPFLERIVATIALVFVAAVAAWLYALGRTWSESIGVTPRGFGVGALLVFLPTALAIGLVGSGVGALRGRWPSWLRARQAVWIAPAIVVGMATGELWVLHDEVRFLRDVAANANERQSRARAWPNVNSALVYRPGIGVHATD
jgi:hypothetical protein